MDSALGGDGYAYEMCKRPGSRGLTGIDQDAGAIEMARGRLLPFQDKITIIRNNYANIKEVLKELGAEGMGGIYLNLGVSSYQLDTASRGSIYREDAPFGMRMGQRNDVTTACIISIYNEIELYRTARDYGEDNFTKNTAKHIVRAREKHPIKTTRELAEIMKGAIPTRVRTTGGYPAERTFQTIRIECSCELEVLGQSTDTMIDLLNPGDRSSITTFHSLEDRIIESRFRLNENPCIHPHDLSVCVHGRRSKGKVVSRKPILPLEKGLEENSCSKGAKLRVPERGQFW